MKNIHLVLLCDFIPLFYLVIFGSVKFFSSRHLIVIGKQARLDAVAITVGMTSNMLYVKRYGFFPVTSYITNGTTSPWCVMRTRKIVSI